MICYTKVRINIEIPNKISIYIKKLIVVLSEGKKEEVSKRLKQKFEYDGPFIDRVLNIDPTGYKYAEYIGRYLEFVIPVIAGDTGGLSVSNQNKLENILEKSIPWFHRNFKKITEKDIEIAENNYKETIGRPVSNIDGIKNSIRDINQYINPNFILQLIPIVDGRKSQREREKELKFQSKKIYEDDNVLVVMPMTYEASCYYGANTKWCTTSSGSSEYFKKYIKNGELYYFINKKRNEKYALLRDFENRRTEVYNAQDIEVKLNDLRERFPAQSELIDEIIGVGSFVKNLVNFSRGKISEYDLRDSDDLIEKIIIGNPLGQSEIVFDFQDDKKLFELLDLSEDDVWFSQVVNSTYSDYDFYDSYQIRQDFLEGYGVFTYLNKTNLDKLKEIAELIIPGKEFNINDDDYRIELANTLSDLFENEVDYILGEFEIERNRDALISAQERIDSELTNFMESIGFSFYSKYERISTDVSNLIMWIRRLGITKIDAYNLLSQIFSNVGAGKLGGWYDSQYEFSSDKHFDEGSFNSYVENKLEQIIEKIQDNENIDNKKLQEFLELRKRIVTKHKPQVWHKLPSDNNYSFKIFDFDMEDMKIGVEFQKQFSPIKKVYLTEEQFNNVLYNQRLFDLFEL